MLQSLSCSVAYDYEVPLRIWIHLCIALSENETGIFIDTKLLTSPNNCSLRGIEKLTSHTGLLTIGTSPLSDRVIPGSFADTRYYPEKLTEALATEARNFQNLSIHFPILSLKHRSSNIYELTTVKKMSLLQNEDAVKWLHFANRLTYNSAEFSCQTFGGNLLEQSSNVYGMLQQYVANIIKKIYFVSWLSANESSCVSVNVAISKIHLEPSPCEMHLSSICIVPKAQVYRLIGYIDLYAITFSLIGDNFQFLADQDYTMIYEGGKLILYDVNEMVELASTAKGVEPNDLLGRKHWYINKLGTNKYMTLTSCDENQFTCSSGACIDLRKTCDLNVDCSDFSDEKLCNITQKRPSFYNRALASSMQQKVGVFFGLSRIIDLDMAGGTIKVEFAATYHWKDPRVVFHNVHADRYTKVPSEDAKFYWQPNVMIRGVINEDIEALSPTLNPQHTAVRPSTLGNASVFLGQEGKIENFLPRYVPFR